MTGTNDQVLASIIVVTYNSSRDIDEFLLSLKSQTCADFEIIIVDNASEDDTVVQVKSNNLNILLIESGDNLGYAGGNNTGFKYARGKYVVVVNPDTVADKDWLKQLIEPMEKDPSIDITTPKIILYGKNDTLNTCANQCHYTGLDFCRGMNQPSRSYSTPELVGAVSGCSFAIRRSALEKLGGFDGDFFMYLEDIDLSWRARLAGYQILYVPTSIIYHKYSLSIRPLKKFYLERNRYMMLLKNYQWKTIFLISPSLFVTEIITWGNCILHGPTDINHKIHAYFWVIANVNCILKKRREVQGTRKINDRDLIMLLDSRIPFEQIVKNPLFNRLSDAIFNNFYQLYYRAIYRFV